VKNVMYEAMQSIVTMRNQTVLICKIAIDQPRECSGICFEG